jgi:anti-sigma-K factor RskA
LNIKEYISSGVLESYVMGELSLQERAEVEKNLAVYPELRTELTAVEAAQESLLIQTAIAPRTSVRSQLFVKIDDEQKAPVNVVAMKTERSTIGFWRYAAAASIAVALVSSYLAYDYYIRWKHSENRLGELIAQNQRVAQDYNTVNQRLDRIEADLKVIDDPAFTRIIMTGTKNAPGATAYVYWNESSKEVYLSIQNMKKLSNDNQYQLWAIVDGKPVDAGVFDAGVAGLRKMKDIAKGAATFAVTIEPRGGKSSPSLETMQVAGNIGKG